jgi:hypothetical protein
MQAVREGMVSSYSRAKDLPTCKATYWDTPKEKKLDAEQ